MFTNDARQIQRTGKYGTPREQYLQELVNEFQKTTNEVRAIRLIPIGDTSNELIGIAMLMFTSPTSLEGHAPNESKEQIVAHLANFAYDPYNYGFLRKLNVLELFLDCITESNEKLVEFGAGGICNCCPDPANAAIIVENGGIPLMISCLSSPVQNTVLFGIASLYYLCTASTKAEILTPQVLEVMRKYEDARLVNIKFSNLAKAFLDKHVKS